MTVLGKTSDKLRLTTRHVALVAVAVICTVWGIVSYPQKAMACTSPCGCSTSETNNTISHIRNEHDLTRIYITEQFMLHQNWLFGANGITVSFFHSHFLPALQMMTEQLTSNAMMQMLMLVQNMVLHLNTKKFHWVVQTFINYTQFLTLKIQVQIQFFHSLLLLVFLEHSQRVKRLMVQLVDVMQKLLIPPILLHLL